MNRHTLWVMGCLLVLAGCGKADRAGMAGAATAPPALPPLMIAPEDVLTVRSGPLASGPSITGSVQPERRADLRAEVPAVVLQVLKDNGDPVRRGDLLVRLDDTAIRDTLNSAEASARAVEQAYSQAERQYQRVVKLRESSLVSVQDAEDVEIRRNNAKSELEAAKTRVVSARQQFQRTEVRAPFDGIVSDRKVSAGDTTQIGKELLKVIDPHSLRFEGLVSAESIGAVEAGQKVVFRVHGYDEADFTGVVARVNPAANATTRQAEVLVNFAGDKQQPALAGLYAEGRIETTRRAVLTLPATAVVREGDRAFVWRLDGTALHKVEIKLQQRDARSGDYVVGSGVAEGEVVLRYPGSNLSEGRKVDKAAPAAQSANPGSLGSSARTSSSGSSAPDAAGPGG